MESERNTLPARFILASASPRRKELLEQIGIRYEVIPSTVEEVITGVLPEAVVQELSRQKAEDVFGRMEAGDGEALVVIGADTVVSYQNCIMGKPEDEADARRMLESLQGSVHQVYTGVTICFRQKGMPDTSHTFYERTDVSVYPMTEQEITAYIATGEPMDKAGSYGIQGKYAAYIKSVCGDYNNVVGLPLGRVYQELKKKNLAG